jgi:hypothetical protein
MPFPIFVLNKEITRKSFAKIIDIITKDERDLHNE